MNPLKLSLAGVVAAALFGAGCAGPETKLGRGLTNTGEFLRLGEFNRNIEQTELLDSPRAAYTTGAIRGFNASLYRTLVGLYEVVTFPIPNHKHADYGPILTPEYPVYPDSYVPGSFADSITSTDSYIGFSQGDIAPMIPGSRFRVFDP
jgi:putative exosortase-associated protein (TIGR04073 family)